MNTALSRLTDPGTSHAAAESIDVTKLESVILERLRSHGPATSHALAKDLALELVSVSPRLGPLARKQLVRDSGLRVRGVSGRAQIVWTAVD